MAVKENLKNTKTTPILLAVLMGLVMLCIVVVCNFTLDEIRERMRQDAEVTMASKSTNQIALLAVWSGTIFNRLEAFVGHEAVQYFAYHIKGESIPAKDVLDAAASMSYADGTPGNVHELPEWQKELPEVGRQFEDFVNKNPEFSAAILVNEKLEIYFSPKSVPEFNEEQEKRMLYALNEGKPQLLPVRRVDKKLLIDIAVPVYTPKFVSARGKSIVALFVCSCDITDLVKRADQIDDKYLFTSALLEDTGKGLRLLDTERPNECGYDLPDWELEDGKLPLGKRFLPARIGQGAPAYTMALPVPDTPWYVLQSLSEADAESKFMPVRRNVLIAAGLAMALAGIFMLALWWWVVGRRERAVADEMRDLYQMVNDQKQILDGVNSALSAGVVLNDLSGTIYYVNPSYAAMANMDPHLMHGMSYKDLPIDMARSLASHTNTVDGNGQMATFTEDFEVGGQRHHYLTKSSPFLDAEGNLVGIVSVYSDVSDLVAAQARAQRMVTQTVAVFLRSIEAHDPYLGGHSFLTAELAVVLAYCLGVNDEETMDTLRTSASLSQIGMIHLPRQLLLKQGALTPEERKFMQRHVQYAAAALEGIDFGLPVLPAIVQMYERLDGSGYPKKLQGDQICFNARILAVANTFVALMRPRSYRSPHTVESALSILDSTPPKYDPQVVSALRSYLVTENGRAYLEKLSRTNNAQRGKQQQVEAGKDA